MPDTLQEQVAAIWARALGVKKVAPDDNFFAIGGHSLLGVKMIAEIQAKTGMEEELRLADLLEFPTLGAFTAHLESLMAPSEETGSSSAGSRPRPAPRHFLGMAARKAAPAPRSDKTALFQRRPRFRGTPGRP